MLRAAGANRAAGIADRALENGEWYMCKAASVGSVIRRYGVSTAKADAWRAICRTDPQTKVIIAE